MLTLPTLLISIDVSVLYVALPSLSRDLHASATQQLWILDIYSFMLAGLLVTMGGLADRIGSRRLLLVGGTAHRFVFGHKAKLDDLVGRELTWESAPRASVICLPHPSGASTWLNDPARVELWRRAIALLRDRWAAITA